MYVSCDRPNRIIQSIRPNVAERAMGVDVVIWESLAVTGGLNILWAGGVVCLQETPRNWTALGIECPHREGHNANCPMIWTTNSSSRYQFQIKGDYGDAQRSREGLTAFGWLTRLIIVKGTDDALCCSPRSSSIYCLYSAFADRSIRCCVFEFLF
jgi:hypothetical protein